MGEIMKEMSVNMQVFAITHLPQIAERKMFILKYLNQLLVRIHNQSSKY
jgi:DNA repair ATPase RecN